MTGPERTTTPALLVKGDAIMGAKDGKEWTVAEVRPAAQGIAATVLLERAGDGRVATVTVASLPAQVALLETAAERHERAVALTTVRLGGEVVGVKDTDGPYRVPATFPDVAAMLAHLYLFHQPADRDPKAPAVYPDGPMAALQVSHGADHERVLLVPHVHERGFYTAALDLITRPA